MYEILFSIPEQFHNKTLNVLFDINTSYLLQVIWFPVNVAQ